MDYRDYLSLDNDVSQDTIAVYEQSLISGMSDTEASETAEASYKSYDPYDDKRLAVIALAVVQHRLGRVRKNVLKSALESLAELRRSTVTAQCILADPEEIGLIENELRSPVPKRISIKKPTPFQCPWRDGDVFAFPLTSEEAKKTFLIGKYILMQKIREVPDWPKGTLPVVRFKISSTAAPDTSFEEIEEMDHVQLWSTTYDFNNQEFREDDQWYESGLTYEQAYQAFEDRRKMYPIDEDGKLKVFQGSIYFTASWTQPADWKYLGRFPLWTPHKLEFVPKNSLCLPSLSAAELEELLVKRINQFQPSIRDNQTYD